MGRHPRYLPDPPPTAVTESPANNQHNTDADYVDVVDAIDEDHQAFVDATADKDLPPDLTSADWAIFREIDAIRSDNVAVVEEDAYVPPPSHNFPSSEYRSSRVRGRFTGRLYATRPTAQTLAETLSTVLLRHLKLPTMYS
ncbi:hypothetical protein Pst134EB_027599 [Puccinia striiformis f. sp. tritici]|nr:hypothetical protein Pst134EB_027599 [Puccinia striiformis f. sp. tritici]